MSTWLTAPPSAWNRNLKMTPVTISGRSQGTMTSERANVLPGNRRLNSKAREKPIRNCADEGSDGEHERVDDRRPGSWGREGRSGSCRARRTAR